jgi:hypothetical protein
MASRARLDFLVLGLHHGVDIFRGNYKCRSEGYNARAPISEAYQQTDIEVKDPSCRRGIIHTIHRFGAMHVYYRLRMLHASSPYTNGIRDQATVSVNAEDLKEKVLALN